LGLERKKEGSLDPRWERSFLRLRQFRRCFGHCHVPSEWAENVDLGKWVVKMRRLNREGRLSREKLRRLNEVGFVWDVKGKREAEQDVVWSKWLAKLHTFHRQHGHWRVPTDQRRFHRLRVWMDNQRISYRRGWLSAERIRRLEKVKFPWVSDRGLQVASRVN
jgi:Helicase associated domain